MKLQSYKTVWFTMQYMEKLWIFFINVHSVKYMPSCTYFCPIFVPIFTYYIKIENQAVSTKKVTKKEEHSF